MILDAALLVQVVLLLGSLVALYYGAELALGAAEKVGLAFGIPPLAVGLLIVGFGTSLPEFFVSHSACLHGDFPMSMGNILGSNSANLFLIMGIVGLAVDIRLVGGDIFRQLGLHLVMTVALVAVVYWATEFSLVYGFVLGLFFVAHLYLSLGSIRRYAPCGGRRGVGMGTFSILFLGLGLLYGGGELLVYSGSNLGDAIGVSTFVISAIFVAFGTSFPELVTCLVAVKSRRDTDFIVGNLIGSNIFNISFVLASLAPYRLPLEGGYFVDALVLLLAACFLIGLCGFKRNFGRIAGLFFLAVYGLSVWRWLG